MHRSDLVSLATASLHWLPVNSRIEFKIFLFTYKAFNGQAPSYLKELLVPFYSTRTLAMSMHQLTMHIYIYIYIYIYSKKNHFVILSNWYHQHDNMISSVSPDLNPVDHLWEVEEQKTGSRNVQLTN